MKYRKVIWNKGLGNSKKAVIIFMALLIIMLFIPSCASSPDTEFISLTSDSNSAVSLANNSAKAGADSIALQVGKITLPAQLDRLSLVRQLSKTQVDIQETVQWAAPLDKLIKQTLTKDLAAKLPDKNVLPSKAPVNNKQRHILVLNISKFASDKNNKVSLDCYWSLIEASSQKPIKSAKISITTKAKSSSGSAIAQAMSQALLKLAVAIAKRL